MRALYGLPNPSRGTKWPCFVPRTSNLRFRGTFYPLSVPQTSNFRIRGTFGGLFVPRHGSIHVQFPHPVGFYPLPANGASIFTVPSLPKVCVLHKVQHIKIPQPHPGSMRFCINRAHFQDVSSHTIFLTEILLYHMPEVEEKVLTSGRKKEKESRTRIR